jgi:hypothetical protein
MKMKKSGLAALAAGGAVGMLLGPAPPASAAPAGVESAPDTVNRLESEGYTVILNKVGSAALSECAVTAVRPGQTYVRTDSGIPGAHSGLDGTIGELTFTELSKTVYVDLKC